MNKSIILAVIVVAAAPGLAKADSALVYASVQDGTFNGVAMFTPALGFVNQVATDGPIQGLTTDGNGDFYVAVGNHTTEYSNAGTQLNTITASTTTSTPALAFGGGVVYAAVQDGTFNGVAMFTPALGFINQVASDGPILGLATDGAGDFYISVGDHTTEYNNAGTQLNTITASSTTVTAALAFGDDIVYASVEDGTFNGVAMFSPTLGFINQVATDGPILGLTADGMGDFYVSVGDHTSEYSNAGTLLNTITASTTTTTAALAYSAGTPVPEPATLGVIMAGAAGLLMRRRGRKG